MTLYCIRNYIKAVLPGAGKEVKTMKKGKSMLVLGGAIRPFEAATRRGFTGVLPRENGSALGA